MSFLVMSGGNSTLIGGGGGWTRLERRHRRRWVGSVVSSLACPSYKVWCACKSQSAASFKHLEGLVSAERRLLAVAASAVMSDPAQPSSPGARTDGGQNGEGPPEVPPNSTSNRHLEHTQAQVDEVIEILHGNVEKVLKRDIELSQLDEQADSLHDSAQQSESQATALARKCCWKIAKMMIILGVICVIVAIAIARKYHEEPR